MAVKKGRKKKNTNKKNEVLGVLFIALGILFSLPIYFNITSAGGTLFYDIAFGFFGLMGYVMPLVLIFIGVLCILARKKYANPGKIVLVVLIVIFVMCFCQTAAIENINTSGDFSSYVDSSYQIGKVDCAGGGIIGSLLVYPVYLALGQIGCCIVFIAGMVVCIIALTNLSLKRMGEEVGHVVKNTYNDYKTKSDEYKEAKRQIAFDEDDYYDDDDEVRYEQEDDYAKKAKHAKKEELYVHNLQGEDDTKERIAYRENPYDIKIETESNKINIKKMFRPKKQKKHPELDESFYELSRKAIFEENPEIYDFGNGYNYTIDKKDENSIYDGARYKEVFSDTDVKFDDDGKEVIKTRRRIGVPEDEHINPENTPVTSTFLDDEPAYEEETANTTARKIGVGAGAAAAAVTASAVGAKAATDVKTEDISKENIEIPVNDENDDEYILPPVSLLNPVKHKAQTSNVDIDGSSKKLEATLKSFGVEAKVENVSVGPVVTRYEIKPKSGVRVSKIVNLADDIALSFGVAGIRIEAPIPGKMAVGIEVPNRDRVGVTFREMLDCDEFKNLKSTTAFALGKDIAGKNVYGDIAKMPHLLIAGATGAGKSVCTNSIIASILFHATPKEVKMIMIDPKVVELEEYNNIPHLLIPVVTDPKKAASALNWAVNEMTLRYRLFAKKSAKDLERYNAVMESEGKDTLPKIVIFVDELADLMMVCAKEVEDSICRIAQLGRASGIHLVIATQRPSVDVITGLIKANIPSRIALTVSSMQDSRTILDKGGAEKLLGRGDMLYAPTGAPKPIRVQGCYVDDNEIKALTTFIKDNSKDEYGYDEKVSENIDSDKITAFDDEEDEKDPLFEKAVGIVVEYDQASISMLQRRLRIGYARAARLIDEMEINNIVSGFEGSKPRQVLITKEQYKEMFGITEDSEEQ